MSDWTNHPEFPIYPLGDMQGCQPSFGMGLRQHYAGLMMQAQFIHHGAKGDYSWNEAEAAKQAVSCADALIKELAKARGES
jgi:hypothetical protein